MLLPNIISFKGFKALAFVGGDHDNVYAIDYDFSRLFWSRHLDAARRQCEAEWVRLMSGRL